VRIVLSIPNRAIRRTATIVSLLSANATMSLHAPQGRSMQGMLGCAISYSLFPPILPPVGFSCD
jgi:hypothetical protein